MGVIQRRLGPRLLVLALVFSVAGCVTTVEPPLTSVEPGQVADVLFINDPRDGDSFVASNGVEYRVGMVNTPEVGSCGAAEATAFTTSLLQHGFTAQAYSTDNHGRAVARITAFDGQDLGLELARSGHADDRYLDNFRHENPAYAAELDAAFAEADAARAAGRATAPSC